MAAQRQDCRPYDRLQSGRVNGLRNAAIFGLASLIVILPITSVTQASPFTVHNQSPTNRVIGLMAAAPARRVAQPGMQLSGALDWSSIASASRNSDEDIVLDGETVTLTLNAAMDRAEWRWWASLPVYNQSGGTLDGFINDYHQLFGFPEGDRPAQTKDTLLYSYLVNGVDLLGVQSDDSGIGDLRLGATRYLSTSADTALAARFQLKLPTGDSDSLFGSGAVDFSVAIDAERRPRNSDMQLFAGAGLIATGDGDVLPDIKNNALVFAYAGLTYPLLAALDLTLQLDATSAPYDSDLPELGNSVQITVGGVWKFNDRWELAIAVGEDVAVHSAPDVDLHFELRRQQ